MDDKIQKKGNKREIIIKMDNIKLLINCKDHDYEEVLAESLVNLQKGFLVACGGGLETGNSEEAEWADLILEERGNDEGTAEVGDGGSKYMYLTEIRDGNSEGDIIYKYEEVSTIAERLRTRFRELTGKCCLLRSDGKGVIIGFCSGMGGVGKSVLALSVARELAEEGQKRVLYLSFEPLSSGQIYMGGGAEVRPSGDYLYYLFSKKGEVPPDLGEFLFHDSYGVESFRIRSDRNELADLSWEQSEIFLDALLQSRRHDYICVDFDGDGTEKSKRLALSSFRLFMIGREGVLSEARKKQLLDSWNLTEEESASLIVDVCNFCKEEKRGNTVYVPKDEGSFREKNGYVEIGLHRAFGLGVRKLAEEIRRNV